MPPSTTSEWVNVTERLRRAAAERPEAMAIAELLPSRQPGQGQQAYRTVTFAQLEAEVQALAAGIRAYGIPPATRLALLVPPSIEFITLVFALLRAGVVIVLIDPGMGRKNLIRCLSEARPEGFVAVPLAQAIRILLRRKFSLAKWNITVGRRWFWGGMTLEEVRHQGSSVGRHPSTGEGIQPSTRADDPAAIIFTTGSTGPPKGVLYRHRTFDQQVEQIQEQYGIVGDEVDLPCFPLFGLFNAAMGVSTVLPRMDFSRPASVDPRNIIAAVNDWQVTQSFGSPAVWNRVGPYCESRGIRLSTLRRVMSAGAPVPAHVLRRMKACISADGEVHTPYGATEALPIATIAASEVLTETQAKTAAGAGVCVGRRFSGIRWRVIHIVDGPLPTIDQVEELPAGEIGELIVSGPVVTDQYVTRTEANATGKIRDGETVWHRMGDVGYLDEQDRFWFCGRMAHRVLTPEGPLYTIPCEAIFNNHPAVFRSALVGVGPAGRQQPVIIVQPHELPADAAAREKLLVELAVLAESSILTKSIRRFLIHPDFPVDIRHNAKIFREKLAVWAAEHS